MKKMFVYLLVLNFIMLLALGCGKKVSEKEYFELASKNMNSEKWSDAEKYFQEIIKKYPEGEYASKALFMLGFINANYLKNYEKAKKYYSDFIVKYPKSELTDDAKYEINNLGKDINNLPLFKDEKTKADSVTVSLAKRKRASAK